MTMKVLPGLVGAIDVCDITNVVPRTPTTCTLYLLGNSALQCTASAAAVVAAVNASPDTGMMIGPLTSTAGDVYINAQNVLRIFPANGLLGSTWQMETSGGTFTFNAITPVEAIASINAAPRCGGGGGGGGGGSVIDWTPVPVLGAIIDYTFWGASATLTEGTEEVRSVVALQVDFRAEVDVMGGGGADGSIILPQPALSSAGGIQCLARASNNDTGASFALGATINDGSNLLEFNVPVGAALSGEFITATILVQYQVGDS
jgi:hypothetical protein